MTTLKVASKFISSTILAAYILFSQAATAGIFEHEFQKDESLWFLAKVYFGKSSEHTKILKDNNLKSAQDVKTGQKLKIIDPLHEPSGSGFKARYEKLKAERASQLAGATKTNKHLEKNSLQGEIKSEPTSSAKSSGESAIVVDKSIRLEAEYFCTRNPNEHPGCQ